MFRINELEATLADERALAAVLTAIPLPHTVRALLRRPFFGRRWDRARQCDFWLSSDGATVVCLTISGASAATIARMRSRFDDLRLKTPGLQPSKGMLLDLLAAIAREHNSRP